MSKADTALAEPILKEAPVDLNPGLIAVAQALSRSVSIRGTNMLSPKQAMKLLDRLPVQSSVAPELTRPGIQAAREAIEKLCGHDINETCYLKTGQLIDLMHKMAGVLPQERRYA